MCRSLFDTAHSELTVKGLFRFGQRHSKRAALSENAIDTDFTAVGDDNLVSDVQP